MKFDDLDARMRVFETAHDHCVLPGMYMVARLDGRHFTTFTREVMKYAAPFDEKFRDAMRLTVKHLMTCGFRVVYGYTESDEISLLLHPEETVFQRKLRKLHSVLAGEASARFSLAVGTVAVFDCRISQLPNRELVRDYFRWRAEDAHRNALNAWCYWTLRQHGAAPETAATRLASVSVADKEKLLEGYGISFAQVPNWQKRGLGIYWERFEKTAFNPQTGQEVLAQRKRLHCEPDLPVGSAYDRFLEILVP
ncbi:MAG: guanylyltransferase [Blastocatellia bacterium]|nr:guanylyltransferase [Blastocatellia bacterium]